MIKSCYSAATDSNSPSVCDEQWMFTDGNNEKSSTGLPVWYENGNSSTNSTPPSIAVLAHQKTHFDNVQMFHRCYFSLLVLLLKRHRTVCWYCIHMERIRCTFFLECMKIKKHCFKQQMWWESKYPSLFSAFAWGMDVGYFHSSSDEFKVLSRECHRYGVFQCVGAVQAIVVMFSNLPAIQLF